MARHMKSSSDIPDGGGFPIRMDSQAKGGVRMEIGCSSFGALIASYAHTSPSEDWFLGGVGMLLRASGLMEGDAVHEVGLPVIEVAHQMARELRRERLARREGKPYDASAWGFYASSIANILSTYIEGLSENGSQEAPDGGGIC